MAHLERTQHKPTVHSAYFELTVPIPDLPADGKNVAARIKVAEQRTKEAPFKVHVVVEKQQHVVARLIRSPIARGGKTDVAW